MVFRAFKREVDSHSSLCGTECSGLKERGSWWRTPCEARAGIVSGGGNRNKGGVGKRENREGPTEKAKEGEEMGPRVQRGSPELGEASSTGVSSCHQ